MIQKDIFDLSSFRFIEMPEETAEYRVTDKQMQVYSDRSLKLAKKIAAEKMRLANELNISSSEMSSRIAEQCRIAADTLKKTIRGEQKDGIRTTRRFLYKFTVGLKMSPEKAEEFFVLCGGPLSDHCAADYICKCALRDGDSIDELLEDMKQYADLNLFLRKRSDEK